MAARGKIIQVPNTGDVHDLMAAVGTALHRWSGVECVLQDIFTCCFSPDSQEAALYAFNRVLNLRARIAMTAGALSTVEDLPCHADWAGLGEEISVESKKRNKIAHFGLTNWTDKKGRDRISIEPHLSVFPMKRGKKWENLNEKDVTKFGRDWEELTESLSGFLGELQKHRKLTK